MAKQTPNRESPPATGPPAVLEVDLKDRRLAAFLAWLIPGLGHYYQGRTGKAVLFFVCIVGTFLYGVYIGEGRVVYASTTPSIFTRWQYFFQLGVGLPATPALVQRQRALATKPPLLSEISDKFMRPPRMVGDFRSLDKNSPLRNEVIHPDELAQWNYELGDRFEMGTVYTVIAGLLNLLVIWDAYGGPLVIPPPEDKKKRPGDGDDKKDAA